MSPELAAMEVSGVEIFYSALELRLGLTGK
jgi:hypothetical protein